MIEVHITLLVAIFLLGIQVTCLLAQIKTEDSRWVIGALGLMPIVIILAFAHKIFGG